MSVEKVAKLYLQGYFSNALDSGNRVGQNAYYLNFKSEVIIKGLSINSECELVFHNNVLKFRFK